MKNSGKLMNFLLGISASVLLIGSLFKIQHWPYGDILHTTGLYSYLILSGLEIIRLKKIISDSKIVE